MFGFRQFTFNTIRKNTHQPTAVLLACVGLLILNTQSGCNKSAENQPATQVAVSNTYLEAAVKDLLGSETSVMVLSPPGTCPGHFDMRRSQMDELRNASVLLRFDFQATLDDKLKQLTKAGLSIVPIDATGGMCVPSTYKKVCNQVAIALVASQLLTADNAKCRLEAINNRIETQIQWAQEQANVLKFADYTVVTSAHQKNFAEFLQLNVTNTFSAADVARGQEINKALNNGYETKIVIANEPEGDKLARKIATHLNARLVIFANFPNYKNHHCTYDGLFRANVNTLIEILN